MRQGLWDNFTFTSSHFHPNSFHCLRPMSESFARRYKYPHLPASLLPILQVRSTLRAISISMPSTHTNLPGFPSSFQITCHFLGTYVLSEIWPIFHITCNFLGPYVLSEIILHSLRGAWYMISSSGYISYPIGLVFLLSLTRRFVHHPLNQQTVEGSRAGLDPQEHSTLCRVYMILKPEHRKHSFLYRRHMILQLGSDI